MIKQTAKHLSQSDIAIQIERLVNAVIRHDSPAFRISYDAQGMKSSRGLGSRYCDHIRQMYHLVHDETYALSEHLLAFKEACYDIGIEFGMFGMTCMDESEEGSCQRPRPTTGSWRGSGSTYRPSGSSVGSMTVYAGRNVIGKQSPST